MCPCVTGFLAHHKENPIFPGTQRVRRIRFFNVRRKFCSLEKRAWGCFLIVDEKTGHAKTHPSIVYVRKLFLQYEIHGSVLST